MFELKCLPNGLGTNSVCTKTSTANFPTNQLARTLNRCLFITLVFHWLKTSSCLNKHFTQHKTFDLNRTRFIFKLLQWTRFWQLFYWWFPALGVKTATSGASAAGSPLPTPPTPRTPSNGGRWGRGGRRGTPERICHVKLRVWWQKLWCSARKCWSSTGPCRLRGRKFIVSNRGEVGGLFTADFSFVRIWFIAKALFLVLICSILFHQYQYKRTD